MENAVSSNKTQKYNRNNVFSITGRESASPGGSNPGSVSITQLLVRKAVRWQHSIRDIRIIGKYLTVIVALTIDGVCREGIGTGVANDVASVKIAANEALENAAAKFGITDSSPNTTAFKELSVTDAEIRANPIAQSLLDLVTAKQLGMIRAISREIGIKANEECRSVLNCESDELSKRAASAFISHLQQMQIAAVNTKAA